MNTIKEAGRPKNIIRAEGSNIVFMWNGSLGSLERRYNCGTPENAKFIADWGNQPGHSISWDDTRKMASAREDGVHTTIESILSREKYNIHPNLRRGSGASFDDYSDTTGYLDHTITEAIEAGLSDAEILQILE